MVRTYHNAIYRRAVAVNNTYLVQDNNDIVAYGYLMSLDRSANARYKVYVANTDNSEYNKEIERYIKRFIGNSAKWEHQIINRRTYSVTLMGDYYLGHRFFSIKHSKNI